MAGEEGEEEKLLVDLRRSSLMASPQVINVRATVRLDTLLSSPSNMDKIYSVKSILYS